MADEVKEAPIQEESKELETGKAEPEVDAKADTKEATLGDILETNKPEKTENPKLVPEAVLLEYKKDNKELKKDIKDLKKLIEDGASKKEVSQELKDIAEEHNIDPDFLDKLARSIKAQTKAELEGEFSSKMKPIEEKERKAAQDKKFDEIYSNILETMPEYKSIVNKEVIKTLSLNPANANKTFAKILEESYGHLIQGKKTIETTSPRGGQEDIAIDYAKAVKDSKYFAEIMADPDLKRKYNEDLQKRIKL